MKPREGAEVERPSAGPLGAIPVLQAMPSEASTKKGNNTHPATPDSKQQPAFTYESKAASPMAAKDLYTRMMGAIVPSRTVGDLLVLSGDLRKEMVDQCRTHCVPNPVGLTTSVTTSLPYVTVEVNHTTSLHELEVILRGNRVEKGLLDEGSEIVLFQKDLWQEVGLPANKKAVMTMQTVNSGLLVMVGCIEMMGLEVGGIMT